MVGKGSEPKSSRIFQQCYMKCCKLQNLTPLNNVIPSGNGKVLDFCVDRIKYTDWPPILNALSCDLSLHSVSIKCRNQVKTVLEHIDCERLAKTVNKRAVILTKFMLTNLIEASSQLLANTTLLTTLVLEGLPLKIPYLNPLCEALLTNNSLQHLSMSRCLIGDAGCLAICKSVRCLPNILTLDMSGCELTPIGGGYIADLVKYQKLQRYSENWSHTLRYRMPQLDTMAGLRRITLCANPSFTHAGASALFDVLADDLWIKALDIQNCGLIEDTAAAALRMLTSNTTLVVLDLRHNLDISGESLSKVRAALRDNERGVSGGQFSWLSTTSWSTSDIRMVKYNASKNVIIKDRTPSNARNIPTKYASKTATIKKEKDYAEALEEQLQEEISHRQQLEELNLQLVDQMKNLKRQQIPLWANTASSGSEHSLKASSRSGDLSSSSGSSSVPIDQNTLSYIQQAFKDIYSFIKNNQCHGQCIETKLTELSVRESTDTGIANVPASDEVGTGAAGERRRTVARAHSTHEPLSDVKVNKTTKSAHLLGDAHRIRKSNDTKPEIIERQIGDTKDSRNECSNVMEGIVSAHTKMKKGGARNSPSSSGASDSDTLVSSPRTAQRESRDTVREVQHINPRDALFSSSDEDSADDD